MELQEHALELARELGVDLRFDVEPYDGRYDPITNVIRTAPIRDHGFRVSPDGQHNLNITAETSYFVALHELGHKADPNLDMSDYRANLAPEKILAEEGFAWLWAVNKSLIAPTPEARVFARAALKLYHDLRPNAVTPREWADAMEVLA